MAKITGPLLSFGAKGTIAKTQTYATWRGIQYARRWTKPENPQTAAQQATRMLFRSLSQLWTVAPAGLKAPWNRFAAGRQFTGQNAFVGQNIALLRGDAGFDNFKGSPGSGGGVPATGITVTPVAGGFDVTFGIPDTPAGWTLAAACVTAIPNGDPVEPFTGQVVYAEDVAAPFAPELRGLTPGTEYVASGWLRWTTEGNRTAYSPALVDVATTPA